MHQASCLLCHSYFLFHLIYHLFIIYSACSGSMREVSCGNIVLAIVIYLLVLLFIHSILFSAWQRQHA
jgi:hypothetical protein